MFFLNKATCPCTNMRKYVACAYCMVKHIFNSCLNINSLSEKIISLRNVISKSKLEVLCIDETKLDLSFPDTQFKTEGYQFPLFRKDRNSDGGGKIVYVREGLVTKQLPLFESPAIESICIELTISKSKWCILFAYRPPNFNKKEFFNEISNSLSNIITNYDNVVLAGDLNINLLDPSADTENHLSDLIDIFDLKNIVKEPTYFKSEKGSLIDIILTNKPRSFKKTQGFVTGLSNFHKLVVTVLRSFYKKLSPIIETIKLLTKILS